MTTIVVATTGLTRPTISSSARSQSMASATNNRQSSVAARLAAGNNPNSITSRRASGANLIAASSASSSLSSKSSSLVQNSNNNRQLSAKSAVLKIPPLSTALVQSGSVANVAKQVASSTSTTTTTPISPSSSHKVRPTGGISMLPQPQPPPPLPPSSPPQPSGVPSSSSSSSHSQHQQRSAASRVASSVATPTPPPQPATTTTNKMAVASANNNARQVHRQNGVAKTNSVPSSQHHNAAIKVDDEPTTAVQLIKPTSKETTIGVETNTIAVQCEKVALENSSVNTILSCFNQRQEETQTLTTCRDLELACNQMTARFLAMSVVCQELTQKLAQSHGRSRQLVEENKQNELKFREEFNSTISQLITEHATSAALSKQQYEQELEKFDQCCKAKILETEERLAAEHVQQLRDLEFEWSGRLTAVKDEFIAQLQLQRQEAEKRERELSAMVCTEDEAVVRRVEAETARFKAAFAENDSLRAVLDLRSAELRQLRAENAQLRVNIEEMPDFRDRINQLEHQIENLEAVLSTKREQERVLTERQRELLQRVEDVEAEKRHIWRACEVLAFQLQSAGLLPLSSSSSSSPSMLPTVKTPTLETPASPSPTNKTGRIGPPFSSSTPLIPAGCKARFLIANDDDFGALHHNSSITSIDADCSSPPMMLEPNTCSPETESILQKIIESSVSQQELAVNCSDTSSKASSQGVYSASSDSASPRSVSSSNASVSPPPPPNHHDLQTMEDPLHHLSISTSGCFSSNEMMIEELNKITSSGFTD